MVFELIHREVFRAALEVDIAAGAEEPGTWATATYVFHRTSD